MASLGGTKVPVELNTRYSIEILSILFTYFNCTGTLKQTENQLHSLELYTMCDAFDEVLTAAGMEHLASNWLKASEQIGDVKGILEEAF